MAAVN
jgi:hypothetical protein